jgi:hypothetical protein
MASNKKVIDDVNTTFDKRAIVAIIPLTIILIIGVIFWNWSIENFLTGFGLLMAFAILSNWNNWFKKSSKRNRGIAGNL